METKENESGRAMNTQEAFDIIWERAKDLRRAGEEDNWTCYYRHPDDPTFRCFVGECIPDEEYSNEFEGCDVIAIDVPSLRGVNLDFLIQAQNVHDEENPCDWQHGLRMLAAKHDLTVPND